MIQNNCTQEAIQMTQIKQRLEYLRGELHAERISYGELDELQSLVPYIDPDDVELLEAAGVPEFDGPVPIRKIIQTIRERSARPSIRFLDVIYGPQAKKLRHDVALMLKGDKPTAKEIQYGNLRLALLKAVNAQGNCIAALDADFQTKATNILEYWNTPEFQNGSM